MVKYVIALGMPLWLAVLAAGCADSAGSAGPCRVGMCAGATPPTIPNGVISRSISWENQTGAKGAGGMAGNGRKGSPAIPNVKSGETATLMDIDGTGVIRHIWITVSERSPEALRNLIIRMYWDGSEIPSVEAPLGDFFANAHGRLVDMESAYITTPRGRAFNCYFPMPFAKHAKITVTNDMPNDTILRALFFQIDYELHDRLPPSTGYFHARFNRQNPTIEKQDYVLLDHVQGPGLFLGCTLGVRALRSDWWGEGEMKFYLDGDTEYPTICGTGAEDYMNTGYGMGLYQTPWQGCTLNLTDKQFRYPLVSMYRFHEKDPVYFQKDLKVTIQQLGWSRSGIYERSDDYCSVAYWYQLKPTTYQAPFPDRAARTEGILTQPTTAPEK